MAWIEKVTKILKAKMDSKMRFIWTMLLVYMSMVRYLRYRHLRKLQAKYPDPQQVLDDPEAAQEIYSNFANREFPCK